MWGGICISDEHQGKGLVPHFLPQCVIILSHRVPRGQEMGEGEVVSLGLSQEGEFSWLDRSVSTQYLALLLSVIL